MASDGPQLDTAIEIVTPENIAFSYRLAGPFRRLPALVIDYIAKVGLVLGLFIVFNFILGWMMVLLPGLRPLIETIMGASVSFSMVLWFALNWFYGGFFETYWNGQTLGKRLLGMRVVSVSGKPINGLQAVVRNVLREADVMPFVSLGFINYELRPLYALPTCIVGLMTMMMNRRFQRLGDLVSGTLVVIEERSWLAGVAKLEDSRAMELAAYLPTDFVISRSLARAISAYVDRRRFFSPARRREIAHHLAEPLLRMFGMPADTSHDLLLCALYYRAFIADLGDQARDDKPVGNPFQIQTTVATGGVYQ